MGTQSRQVGYTIIEVTLFMAISGALLAIAIFATGSTIRNFRFTDSSRALGAYVQKQYDNILNGVNTRQTPIACENGVVGSGSPRDPGTGNCLLMGKLLIFRVGNPDGNVVTAYDIVGTEPTVVDLAKTDEQLIYEFEPKAVATVGMTTFDIPWGAYVSGVKRPVDGQASNALALIRSPRSTRIVAYSYKETNATPTVDVATVVNPTNDNSGKEVNYCIKSADGIGTAAKVMVGTGGNQSAAQVFFETPDSDCDGV